jgi:hypothetical protein
MSAIELGQTGAQLAARPDGPRDSSDEDGNERGEERFEEAAHFAGML